MDRVIFFLGLTASLGVAPLARPQDVTSDTPQDIQFVHGFWQRSQTGSAEAAPRLQISSQVHVVLRGVPGGNLVMFRLIQRVRARTAQQGAAKLSGNASINTAAGVTIVSAVGMPEYSTLELNVSPQVKGASIEVQRGGNIEIHNFPGAVQARTLFGDIQAVNIGGPVSAYTGGGHVWLGKVDGRVDCSTGAGSITVASANGIHCQTGGGEIVVKQSNGPVWLSSGGGDIEVENATQNVEAYSVKGTIDVGKAGGTVTADTRGGAVRVGSAAGVRVESGSGPVRLTGAQGPLSISTAVGSIIAELLQGARLQDSALVAPAGDITVMIPSNVALSVMATNENGGMPNLESDFSGVHLQAIRFGRPPLAEGAINGGGPTLLLSGSGMIYLRRMK